MSKDNQKELMERLGQKDVMIPQIFVDGLNIGVSILNKFLIIQ